MSQTESIIVTTVVNLEPDRAFAVFTDDIGLWFRLTPNSFGIDRRATGVRFVHEAGARLVADLESDEAEFVIAEVAAWEPGARLLLTDGQTEIEVLFDAHEQGTKVSLEHRGLGSLTSDDLDNAYRYGPRLMLGWYELHLTPEEPQPVGVTPYVIYQDAAAMLDWLTEHFGFVERGRFTGTDGLVHNAELRVNQTEVWVDGRSADPWNGADRPFQWIGVWVDDVDAIHDRLRRLGIDAPAPKNENYGVRSFTVADPEGCMWGFLHRTDNQTGLSPTAAR